MRRGGGTGDGRGDNDNNNNTITTNNSFVQLFLHKGLVSG